MFAAYAHYWDFQGRASRREYWMFFLWMLILGFVGGFVDVVVFHARPGLFGGGPCGIFVTFANLIPNLSLGVRRLHDTDRSGWWTFIVLVPLIGALVLLVFNLLPGNPYENRFGGSEDLSRLDLQETFA
ncbi:MAG: DUF805 domain-containing protein [Caulobacterales bacterium]|nr:DUF805 domain-containing protein [Caulobacterales bacterium]